MGRRKSLAEKWHSALKKLLALPLDLVLGSREQELYCLCSEWSEAIGLSSPDFDSVVLGPGHEPVVEDA